MLIIDNQTNQNINTKKLCSIYKSLCKKDIELIFVSDEEISKINLDFRGKNKPTDVLSFPLLDMPHSPLGSIVISADTAKRVSEELGHSFEDEVILLFIHGFLHISGFDHEVDNGEMREREKELIEQFGLPKSLICRNLD